jgi:serpin B
VEAALDAARLASWVSALAPAEVRVALPKFTIDPKEPIALRETLQALGVRTAFDTSKADFTGIASPPDPADRLAMSAVFHKAFVKVDEKGTEAAAATGALMQTTGAIARPVPPREFTADHPFLFLVRDRGTGALLFMGRVEGP